MQKLNIVYRQIKDLKPYKKNAKKQTKEQVEKISLSKVIVLIRCVMERACR